MASPRHTHHSPYSSTFDPERYYSSGTNAGQQQQQQQRQRSNSLTGHHNHGHPRSPLPAGSVPEHEVLVTNPPFSGDHKVRCCCS